MKFQILIYNNAAFDEAIESEVQEEFRQAHDALMTELKASGELVASNELSQDDAKVVRVERDGAHAVTVTDGPFSESKEWVGGFYQVECASMDRAVEIAGRFVEGRYSPIEVRRLVHE